MRDSSTARKYVYTQVVVRQPVNERLCEATLPNGKVILAHLPRGHTLAFTPGTSLPVRLSLCDFSHGEVMLDEVSLSVSQG